jgi:hypothetical protein
MAGERRVQVVPERWGRPDEHFRKVAQATNALLQGQGNNNFNVTLRANETTTEVEVSFAAQGQAAILAPLTASAAAASGIYAVPETEKVVIHHDAAAATDRNFQLILVG